MTSIWFSILTSGFVNQFPVQRSGACSSRERTYFQITGIFVYMPLSFMHMWQGTENETTASLLGSLREQQNNIARLLRCIRERDFQRDAQRVCCQILKGLLAETKRRVRLAKNYFTSICHVVLYNFILGPIYMVSGTDTALPLRQLYNGILLYIIKCANIPLSLSFHRSFDDSGFC